MKHNHIYYQKVEDAIKPHLEKYDEPRNRREGLIQDILDALFREPYNIVDWREQEISRLKRNFDKKARSRGFTTQSVDHGVDIIGDEKD